MFRIILFNPFGLRRSQIVATAEQYMDAIVTAEALIESLEEEHGDFYHRTYTIIPRDYQVLAVHLRSKIKVAIEVIYCKSDDMSPTFEITANGDIVHCPSKHSFAGLYSYEKDDEELERLLIHHEAYHLIQPKMICNI